MQAVRRSSGEIFTDKYKELEKVIRQKFGDTAGNSPVYYLIHKTGYEEYANKLDCCREIRNLISHFPKEKGAFPIEPSREMIAFLDEVIFKLTNRPKCIDYAIPFRKIYARGIDDSVVDAMAVMREKVYTHVPIVSGRKVIGMFDENSLFCYLADNGIVDLEGLKFSDIRDYIGLENREMEVFTFHHKYTYLDELQDEFQRQFDKRKRLGVAFITETGKRSEDVIAMLTAWEVIGTD